LLYCYHKKNKLSILLTAKSSREGLRMENTINNFCFIAPKNCGRLDSFMSKESGLSRNKVKKLLEEGHIHINGVICKNASLRLVGGEELTMQNPQVNNTLVASDAPLEILYQDDDIAVIVKNAGLTVHPCPSCEEETLVHRLLHHFPQLKNMEGERPGIVHRLDKDTSGLIIIALHEEARLRLANAFAEKNINKTYLALVQGLCKSDMSQESIGRHPTHKTKMAQVPLNKGGREAHSEWTRIYPPVFAEAATRLGKNVPIPKEFQSSFSLVAIKIYTGKTHQVRVHMSEAGYPLLGDSTYSPKDVARLAPRQMLHAWKLHFHHPMTDEELSFTCPLPEDFIRTVLNLWAQENCFQKIIITGNSGTGKTALLNAFAKKGIPTFSADACVQSLYEPQADAWYILRSQYGQRFIQDEEGEVNKKALFDAMQNDVMRKEIENIIHPLVFSKLADFFTEQKEKACKENSQENLNNSCAIKRETQDTTTQNTTAQTTPTQNTTAQTILAQDTTTQGTAMQNTATQNTAMQSTDFSHDDFYQDSFSQFAVAEIPLWHESKLSANIKDATVICVRCDDKTRWERLKARGWDEKTIAHMDSWQWTQENKAKASLYTVDNTKDSESLDAKAEEFILNITNTQKIHLRKKLKAFQKTMTNHKEL